MGVLARGSRRASAIAMIAIGLASPAAAGLIPGGGPATSDCYAELDVAGIENGTDAVKRNRKAICVDGDPCDTGPCGDGVCDVSVRLCWDQHDPNLPECVPPIALDSLVVRGALAPLLVMPRDVSGSQCTQAHTLSIPTTRNATRPGKLNVRIVAKATFGTTPLVDTDLIRLVCVPRRPEECPTGTTTVPTTLVSTTTRTTTTRIASTTTRTTTSPTTTTRRPTTSSSSTLRATTSSVETTTAPPTTGAPTTTTSNETTSTTQEDGKGHKHGDGDSQVVAMIGLP